MVGNVGKTEPQMRTRTDVINHLALLIAQPLPCKTIAEQVFEYMRGINFNEVGI